MADEKIRLGGMALPNGVLVHGPRSWACAIRRADGTIQVAAEEKRFRATQVKQPFLRGPARLAESLAFLPRLRKLLPEARFPFERPAVLAAMLGSAVVIKTVHDSDRVGAAAQELLNGVLSVAPAALALRGSELAAYHGAEHISIGTYEHGRQREKEHERCGSHRGGSGSGRRTSRRPSSPGPPGYSRRWRSSRRSARRCRKRNCRSSGRRFWRRC